MFARRRLFIPLLLAGLLAGSLVAVVFGQGLGGDGAGGRPPDLDVPQDASAEDQGVRLSVSAAAFSGTATVLAMAVEVDVTVAAGAIVRVHVPSDALIGSAITVEPGAEGFGLAPGAVGFVRLGPLPPNRAARLAIGRLELISEDGTALSVTGNWVLDLKTPDDLAERLRVEQLAGTAAADGPIRLSVHGAVRSASETLVTFLVDADEPVQPLAAPSILISGERLVGGLVREQEDGRLLTYAFPPTPFGSELDIRFTTFVRHDASVAGSVTVDLGAAVSRENPERTPGNPEDGGGWFAVSPGDVLATSGAGLVVTAMLFVPDGSKSPPGPTSHEIRVRLAGTYEERLSFSLVGADGKALALGPTGYGYSQDASGVLSNPRTEIWMGYDDLDQILGPVTITYDGASQEIVRGDWTINLAP